MGWTHDRTAQKKVSFYAFRHDYCQSRSIKKEFCLLHIPNTKHLKCLTVWAEGQQLNATPCENVIYFVFTFHWSQSHTFLIDFPSIWMPLSVIHLHTLRSQSLSRCEILVPWTPFSYCTKFKCPFQCWDFPNRYIYPAPLCTPLSSSRPLNCWAPRQHPLHILYLSHRQESWGKLIFLFSQAFFCLWTYYSCSCWCPC